MKRSWFIVLVWACAGVIGGQLSLAAAGSLPTNHAGSATLHEPLSGVPSVASDVESMPSFQIAQRLQRLRDRYQQLSPEQKEAVQQDVTEWQQAYAGLSKSEQEALAQAFNRSVEKLRGLSPEQRQQLKSNVEEFLDTLHSAIAGLTPERQARLEQALANLSQSYQELTVVQKTQFLYRIAGAVDTMSISPAQKEQIESALHHL